MGSTISLRNIPVSILSYLFNLPVQTYQVLSHAYTVSMIQIFRKTDRRTDRNKYTLDKRMDKHWVTILHSPLT